MNRREFLITSSAAAGLLALQRFASAAAGTIDLYSGSDANIVDLWNNIIRPAFEKAHPGVALKVTDAGDNNGLRAIADRALAALKTKTDPQADLFEQFDPRLPSGASMPVSGSSSLPRTSKATTTSIRLPSIPPTLFPIALAGPARLRYDQARSEGCAEELGAAHHMDQGQSRPVHLQQARQGRLGRQLRPPRDP